MTESGATITVGHDVDVARDACEGKIVTSILPIYTVVAFEGIRPSKPIQDKPVKGRRIGINTN